MVAILGGAAACLLATSFFVRGESGLYRPQFVGAEPPLEQERDGNGRTGPTRADLYRVAGEFEALVQRADAELLPRGWRRSRNGLVLGNSFVSWRLTERHGEQSLVIDDGREVERNFGNFTYAPRDGKPYALVRVSTFDRPVGFLERIRNQLPF
jgi:hypothetical protein